MMIALFLAALFHPDMQLLDHASVTSIMQGRDLYAQRCASCHSENGKGGKNGPSLLGVGDAAVDFWIGTGRMPAAVPWVQVDHQPLKISPRQMVAIEQYLHHRDHSGPAIPIVSASTHLAHGRELFSQNCEHCHGVSGDGASISNIEWAPDLHQADSTQIAEAIRTGPAQMPRFSQTQLSPRDVDDIVAYVHSLDKAHAAIRLPTETSGPVPEGLLGWIVVLVLCIAAYFYSKDAKQRKPPNH